MEKDWMEYKYKSGRTMFLYNKVTGEHKLPPGLNSEIQGKIIYGQPVTYKEFCTIATQTDDNGCNNGCLSMYINTDLSCVSSSSNAMLSQHNSGVSDKEKKLNSVPFSPHDSLKHKLNQSSTMATVIEEVIIIENNLVENSNGDAIIYNNDHSNYFLVNADNQVYEKNSNSTDIISGGDSRCNNNDGSQIDGGNDQCCNDNFGDDLSQDGCSNVGRKIDHSDDDNHSDDNASIIVSQVTEKKNQDLDEDVACYEDLNYIMSDNDHDCGENSECITTLDNETKVEAQAQEKTQHNKNFDCKKKIVTKTSVERHRIQSNMQSFECSYCQKTFTKKDHLRRHTKIHTSEKLYKCSVCMKSFLKHFNMKRHANTHIGEKPFECTLCKKRFARKADLLRHVNIHDRPLDTPSQV